MNSMADGLDELVTVVNEKYMVATVVYVFLER